MYMRIKVLFFVCLLPVLVWGQNRKPMASWYVDGNKEKSENRSHTALEATDQGYSVVYATNGVDLILTNLRMNKTSGGIVDSDRRQTGVNSALLADAASRVRVEFCDVTSHAPQSDGITASGDSTRIIITKGTVTTNRPGSVGISSIHGAEISVTETQMATYDHQSAAFYALDGGKLDITAALGKTGGQGSPLFHSSGVMTATKCRMTSGKWTVGNVEDGSLDLSKNVVSAGGVSGFLLYSTKDDNNVHSVLNLTQNSISVGEGPLFMVTNNNDANIIVQGNSFKCKSDELIQVKADEWGVKGSNGGHATLTVNKQTLKGDSYVDSISSLNVVLNKGGRLNGNINKEENRCAKVHVQVNAGGKWTSKGDSYITSITFAQPLEKGLKQLKGKHTIYYDPSDPANAQLEGKEYKTGGGRLCPLK